MGADKEEFPPLLTPGFHRKTMAELRALCVTSPRFKGSATRAEIMSSLEAAVQRLVDAKIECEFWIDGSFLTEKLDPEDADFSVRVDGDFYDNARPHQLSALGSIEKMWQSHRVEGFLHLEWATGRPNYAIGQENFQTWKKQWGESRSGVLKGIVVVELPRGSQ